MTQTYIQIQCVRRQGGHATVDRSASVHDDSALYEPPTTPMHARHPSDGWFVSARLHGFTLAVAGR